MQKQTAGRNNPANPLFKVAALDIEKRKTPNSDKVVKVLISATFKECDSVHGNTLTKNGVPVTVSFRLSIAAASIELKIMLDSGSSAKGVIKVSKVAFAKSLVLKSKSSLTRSVISTTEVKGVLDTGAKAVVSPVGVLPCIRLAANIQGAHSLRRVEAKKKVATITSLNIAATHAADAVSWSVKPDIEGLGNKFLQGSVFATAKGETATACHISCSDKSTASSLMVQASMYVQMSDLQLSDIKISDDIGNRILPEKIISAKMSDLFRPEEAKLRIVKEIIRKHLLDEGMETNGSSVEISRAGG